MGLLLVGIYLIAVGYQGQAGNLILLLSQEGPFLPWAMASGILAWIWRATPPPGRETVHLIIGSAVLGIILLEASKIISGAESAWTNLSSFGSGTAAVPAGTATIESITSPSLPATAVSVGSGAGAGGTYTYPQLVQLASNAGFTGAAATTAAAIALAESSGNPLAVNPNDPSGSFGLLQINQAAHPGTSTMALDPQGSFNLAYQISNGGTNFNPWSTYTSGAYSKFLQ